MKIHSLFFITFIILISSFTVFAQKVSVKKEVLSIDKKEVGYFVENKVYVRQKQFSVLNQQKDTLFTVGREVVFSPLDGEEEAYMHEILSFPNKNIKMNYPIGKGYYLNEKSIIQHFIEIGLIDEELHLNENKIEELKASHQEYPDEIVAALEKEKQESENLDFVVEKPVNGKISFKKIGTTSEKLNYLYKQNIYTFDTYSVISKNDNEEKIIGKVIIRYPTPLPATSSTAKTAPGVRTGSKIASGSSSTTTIFIYNTKGGRVARLGAPNFGSLSIYKGNILEDSTKHKLFREEKTDLNRALRIIDRLILNDKL